MRRWYSDQPERLRKRGEWFHLQGKFDGIDEMNGALRRLDGEKDEKCE